MTTSDSEPHSSGHNSPIETDKAGLVPFPARTDLEWRVPDEDGGQVVKDLAARRFYRFGAVEVFIIKQIDGATPLSAIQARVEQAFEAELDLDTLIAFVTDLDHRGLLRRPGAAPPKAASGWLRGNILYLRFPALDPNRLLERLLPSVGFAFTRGFLWLSAALIALAVSVALANGEEMWRDLHFLLRVETIYAVWLTMLAIVVGHEFAHGLTCKQFGGQVHEMGFMLIFFQPALYCNVSDAWLFPKRSQRLWVTFAGAYFDLVVWSLAVLAWRVLAPETLFSYVALVIAVTSGVRMLFNFNPLIKLDGYYLLSDWLELPNLRKNAFAALRAAWRLPWHAPDPAFQALSPGRRRIYLCYAVFSFLFTVWLLGFIAVTFAEFLVGEFQGIGFIVFLLLLIAVFHKPLQRRWRALVP